MCADATMLRNDLAGDTVVRDGWKVRRGGGGLRMGLRGMKAIGGNMIQAMARLKKPAKKVHGQGSNLEPPVQKS